MLNGNCCTSPDVWRLALNSRSIVESFVVSSTTCCYHDSRITASESLFTKVLLLGLDANVHAEQLCKDREEVAEYVQDEHVDWTTRKRKIRKQSLNYINHVLLS